MDGSQHVLFCAEKVSIFQLVYMTSLHILPYNLFINFGLHCNNVGHLRFCFFSALSLLSPAVFKLFLMFIHFWETERDRVWAGEGAERERETQNPKQAPGAERLAQSPMRGSNSQTARSWPEPKSDTQPTQPPRHPPPTSAMFKSRSKTSSFKIIPFTPQSK